MGEQEIANLRAVEAEPLEVGAYGRESPASAAVDEDVRRSSGQQVDVAVGFGGQGISSLIPAAPTDPPEPFDEPLRAVRERTQRRTVGHSARPPPRRSWPFISLFPR